MPNDNHKVQMQDFLRKKLSKSDDSGGVHLDREEVETVGANMGLGPEEAVRLFESMEGDHWRGHYVACGGGGWIVAWVESVR